MNYLQKIFPILVIHALTPITIESKATSFNQSQIYLVDNIVTYLQQEAQTCKKAQEKKDRLAVVAFIEKLGGLCAGLAPLWLYTKHLEYKNNKTTLCNDNNFFSATYELITTWDKKTPFSAQQKRSIDQFIEQNLFFYGDWLPIKKDFDTPLLAPRKGIPSHYHDPINLLSFLTGEQIKEHLHAIGTVKKIGFINILKQQTKPGRLLFINIGNPENSKTPGHIVTLYTSPDKKCFFYDPSNRNGEIEEPDFPLLVDQIWNNYAHLYANDKDQMLIRVQSFSFMGK